MGCTKRLALLTVCASQFVATAWRQLFDFLGYMWAPILVNFFEIIFSIFGIFGAKQIKSSYILSYAIWTAFWFAWNCFLFCFYESVGLLDRETDSLSFGAGSSSWWQTNGPGCKAVFLPNHTGIEVHPWAPLRPDLITGCIIPYHHLEAVQAALHALFAVIGFGLALSLHYTIKNGKEAKPSTLKKPAPAPIYPVDLMPRRPVSLAVASDQATESSEEPDLRQLRPMTPRRVKRRSISRGTLPPAYAGVSTASGSSTSSVAHNHSQGYYNQGGTLPRRQNYHRSSTRSSSRRPRSNPVTRLMDQQESNTGLKGHTNLMFQHSPENSLVVNSYDHGVLGVQHDASRPPSARSSYSNYHGARSHSYRAGTSGTVVPSLPPASAHSHNFLVQGPPGYSSQSETAI